MLSRSSHSTTSYINSSSSTGGLPGGEVFDLVTASGTRTSERFVT